MEGAKAVLAIDVSCYDMVFVWAIQLVIIVSSDEAIPCNEPGINDCWH
jgi:hypothetical protein